MCGSGSTTQRATHGRSVQVVFDLFLVISKLKIVNSWCQFQNWLVFCATLVFMLFLIVDCNLFSLFNYMSIKNKTSFRNLHSSGGLDVLVVAVCSNFLGRFCTNDKENLVGPVVVHMWPCLFRVYLKRCFYISFGGGLIVIVHTKLRYLQTFIKL